MQATAPKNGQVYSVSNDVSWAFIFFPIVFVLSIVATGMVRKYALRKSILDIPNERSSHTKVVPRGGGLAIVVVFLCALIATAVLDLITPQIAAGLLCSSLIVAVIGFIDDRLNVAVSIRIFAHVCATIILLFSLGGAPAISFGWLVVSTPWVLNLLATLYLVWMLNLYNFMDGIDGIAATESITVTLSVSVLLHLNGGADFATITLTLAAAALGFLLWNWPPAKIFMGDTGSAYLGFMLAALSVTTEVLGLLDFWVWPILLGIFTVDATVTLLRRLIRGERIFEAHRSHAYQHAAQRLASHKRVTLAVAIINIVWLFPIAALVAIGRIDGLLGVCVAYTPLVAVVLAFKAGVDQNTVS